MKRLANYNDDGTFNYKYKEPKPTLGKRLLDVLIIVTATPLLGGALLLNLLSVADASPNGASYHNYRDQPTVPRPEPKCFEDGSCIVSPFIREGASPEEMSYRCPDSGCGDQRIPAGGESNDVDPPMGGREGVPGDAHTGGR